MPRPVSMTSSSASSSSCATRTVTEPPVRRELDRVAEQVPGDLLDAAPRSPSTRQPSSASRTDHAGRPCCVLGRAQAMPRAGSPAREQPAARGSSASLPVVDARHVQQVVDDLAPGCWTVAPDRRRRALHRRQALRPPAARISSSALHRDQVQRMLQLVRHHGQELVLQLVVACAWLAAIAPRARAARAPAPLGLAACRSGRGQILA